MYPFERFTERAKKTLTLAQEEAERSHHSYIGTEHLLLGLLRQTDGDAIEVLKGLEIDIATVRRTIAAVLGRNERIMIQRIIPTSRVKMVIEIAFEEARRVGHDAVDTGHLLMGLVMEGEGIAAHVLDDLGASTQKVVAALEKRWGVNPSGRGKRPVSRIPFPRPPVQAWREMRRIAGRDEPESSPIDLLLQVLADPQIADLMKRRGLDVDRLRSQLLRPPDEVTELRQQVALLRSRLVDAANSHDYAQAAKAQKSIYSAARKLQRAEADWLKSLGA